MMNSPLRAIPWQQTGVTWIRTDGLENGVLATDDQSPRP
jgi:hypothetical protein